MNIKIKKNRDFFAGLMFIFFGIVAIWLAQDYPMGTARRLGPAFFPSFVGGALAVLGFVISALSIRIPNKPVSLHSIRPLIMITGAVVGFALLLEPLGLVLGLFVLVLISCLGGWQFRLFEVAILYIVLSLIAVIFFVYVLGLQFSLWPT
jgi:hypothetical protein